MRILLLLLAPPLVQKRARAPTLTAMISALLDHIVAHVQIPFGLSLTVRIEHIAEHEALCRKLGHRFLALACDCIQRTLRNVHTAA